MSQRSVCKMRSTRQLNPRIEHGEDDFNPVEQIAPHQVRAAHVELADASGALRK